MKHIFAYVGVRKKIPKAANDGASVKKLAHREYYDAQIHGDLSLVPGFSEIFASRSGHIFKGQRRLLGCTNKKGYQRVCIKSEGKSLNHFVHKLVAMAWIGDRPTGFHIDHIDFDKQNNSPENLRYLDHKENSVRRRKSGRGAKQHSTLP